MTVLGGPSTVSPRREDQDDQLCDVISPAALAQKITEVLIDVAPAVTGGQITEIWRRLLVFAKQHGWVED